MSVQLNCAQSNNKASFDSSLTTAVTGAPAAISLSPVVDHLSQSIVVNSINCSLLAAETRCRQAMRQAAERRRRLVAELAMRCPPLTIYGPASDAAGDGGCSAEDEPSVWNHNKTRPFDAVDTISPSQAARLTDYQVKLIGNHTLDSGTPPDKLSAMLRETVKHYIYRELDRFATDITPPLFDVLAARY